MAEALRNLITDVAGIKVGNADDATTGTLKYIGAGDSTS